MKISSYNVTDVAYHYIGLRVLGGFSETAYREEQTNTISRSVKKYVIDKALRLLLPEPTGTFETVGEKICQELVHFKFARSVSKAYQLTDKGRQVLDLLNNRKHIELRRAMVKVHLETYNNLRAVVKKYLQTDGIRMPIIEASQISSKDYIHRLLEPTFGKDTSIKVITFQENIEGKSPKKIEEFLRAEILRNVMPDINVSLFRSLSDRLISLRLLNIMKENIDGCEFATSYSPCVAASPPHPWYLKLDLSLPLLEDIDFAIYFCEPDMANEKTQDNLLAALDLAFSKLSPQAGYYDLPEVRDFVCRHIKIPEVSFDEGINYLLDLQPSPLTAGLRYERISGRRKPLVRTSQISQIHNLIRKT